MKRWAAIFLLAGLPGIRTWRQENKTDSLLTVARTAAADTARIDAWQALATQFMESDPARGIGYGLNTLQSARAIHDSTRIALALQVLGVCYDYKNHLDSCLYYLYAADSIHHIMNRPDLRSHVISDIALAYYLRGNYELSLRNHLRALDLRRKSGNKQYVSKTLNNIGLLYKQRKDYENAVSYYRESIALKEELEDERGLVNTYMNLGSLCFALKRYDSAYAYAAKCNALAEKLHLENDMAGAQANMTKALIAMNRYAESDKMLTEAKRLAEKTNCRDCLFTVYEALGSIHLNRKEPHRAIEWYRKGLQLASQQNRSQVRLGFFERLAEGYARAGNYKSAYLYRDSATVLSQELLNEENLRQINEMTAVYETTEKEKELAALGAEHRASIAEGRRRKRERNYFFFSSLLFMALAGVTYKAYSSNRRKKELLNRQNAVIRQSLQEKEILLREIHHRVKNNLQLVSSLLSLQTDYITDEQVLDAVKESRNRVHSMALIHQNLYQEDDLTGIHVPEYIGKLCDNLFNSYNIRPEKIRLIREIQPIHLDVEVVVPVGLILNELITNCLKYAFPHGREGMIKIILGESNEKIRLCVFDNGIGLPPDINITESGAFGFKMIHAFMRKMKGDIKIFSEDGAKVELTFRNYKRGMHD